MGHDWDGRNLEDSVHLLMQGHEIDSAITQTGKAKNKF